MVTSPMVVQQAIGEKVSMSELGGTAMHASTTGIADFIDDSISAQISHVKKMLDFFLHIAENVRRFMASWSHSMLYPRFLWIPEYPLICSI